MSIKLIVTRGFGNGTFLGAIKDVVTRGFTIGESLVVEGNKMYAKYESKSMSVESIDTSMTPEHVERKMIV